MYKSENKYAVLTCNTNLWSIQGYCLKRLICLKLCIIRERRLCKHEHTYLSVLLHALNHVHVHVVNPVSHLWHVLDHLIRLGRSLLRLDWHNEGERKGEKGFSTIIILFRSVTRLKFKTMCQHVLFFLREREKKKQKKTNKCFTSVTLKSCVLKHISLNFWCMVF